LECHRIYEACEAGSIPIIEDFIPEEKQSCQDPLEPFRRYKAPFIYISDWKELPALLDKLTKDPAWIAQKQKELLEWNKAFKTQIITDFENQLAKLWNLP